MFLLPVTGCDFVVGQRQEGRLESHPCWDSGRDGARAWRPQQVGSDLGKAVGLLSAGP